MLPGRYRTGTSSSSPTRTPSSISALRGSRRLSQGDGAAPLVFRRHAPPQLRAPAPHNARARTAPDARQPRCSALTAGPAPACVLFRANLDAQGGLDFLSVARESFDIPPQTDPLFERVRRFIATARHLRPWRAYGLRLDLQHWMQYTERARRRSPGLRPAAADAAAPAAERIGSGLSHVTSCAPLAICPNFH